MTVTIERDDLAERAAPYRRELLAHCYRMLGSAHDAEDAVQETLLRAWQAREGFEGRSSLRVWLYKIATNACLRALERRERLPMPSGLGAPAPNADAGIGTPRPADAFLEPIPDQWVAVAPPGDPAAIALSRESVRLAFVSALRHLSARQRAVLVLREVLAFSAQEAAEILGTTPAAVNSALQRARAQLAVVSPAAEEAADPTEPGPRKTLERFVHAFESADVRELLTVLRDDIVLEMPPYDTWFRGRETVVGFLARRVLDRPGALRMLPVEANSAPGFAVYQRDEDGGWRAREILVVALTPAGISHVEVFIDADLFELFALPATLAR